MPYTENLNVSQKKVIELIVKNLQKRGVTNKFMQAGILAEVSKEAVFKLVSELGYGKTDNERISTIFKSKLGKMSDAKLNTLKASYEAFFNAVYGGIYGNAANEGYKYRGMGLNGVTFKDNYQAMSKYTESEIVGNQHLLNELPIAVDVLAGYFLNNFQKGAKLSEYNMTSINDAKSLEDIVGAAYHPNEGWGNCLATLK